jgi:23S rRNA (adenine2503-C2)-methyltransferase
VTDLRSLTPAQLEELGRSYGWPGYTALQLFGWLWQKGTRTIDGMTNLSKEKRAQLAGQFTLFWPGIVQVLTDPDGTAKFTFELADGERVESVYIPDRDRGTVCVSSQVGCELGCAFCATARLGLRRNLAWHECCLQVLAVRDWLRRPDRAPHPAPLTNVVFMGMGEPFGNYDAVVQAARVINHEQGLAIGARRITVSTAGIPERICAYARFELQTRLAVSLNASDNETRSRLMPVNREHPLEELLTSVRDYCRVQQKRITFEYVLIDGVNNRDRDVPQLARLLRHLPCKVNLIPLNPFPGCRFRPPKPAEVERFAARLYPLLPAVTIRKSRGAAILAACGQLAAACTTATTLPMHHRPTPPGSPPA